jgi:hypothetical protein
LRERKSFNPKGNGKRSYQRESPPKLVFTRGAMFFARLRREEVEIFRERFDKLADSSLIPH